MMERKSNPPDDPSGSASPSPSSSVSFEEVTYDSSDPSNFESNLQKLIDARIKSYFQQNRLGPKDIERANKQFTDELAKKNDKFAEKIEDKINHTEEQIQNSKQRVTETLGIFVALFTFVSVSFQIFDKANNILQIVSLELILIGSLVLFILLLHLLMQPIKKRNDYGESFFKNKNLLSILHETVNALGKKFILLILNNGVVSFLLIFSILLIFGGAFGVFKSKEENNDQIEQKQLLSPIENNNSFNFINEASPSSAIK